MVPENIGFWKIKKGIPKKKSCFMKQKCLIFKNGYTKKEKC